MNTLRALKRRLTGRLRRRTVARKLKSLDLAPESVAPTLTTATFAGQPTSDLVRECMRIARSMPLDAVWNDHVMFGGALEGMIDRFDAHMLCGLIRTFGVKRVVECSPNKGWSTAFIQLSLPTDSSHISFELEDYRDRIVASVRRHTSLKNWAFVHGDFRQRVQEHLDALAHADLLFIDSDHNQWFAEWYLNDFRIIDRVKPTALVHIHDIYPVGREPTGFGESPFVLRWLEQNPGRFDVIWDYELCRRAETLSNFPVSLFVNHAGERAPNPSLWLKRRTT
jgi:hypothetical protein